MAILNYGTIQGEEGQDVELLNQALASKQVVLPPVVLVEVLSDPGLDPEVKGLFESLPLAEIRERYWQRAGEARARLIAKGFRARVADALIAQCCLDEQMGLLTRDGDFKAFAKICGLVLVQRDREVRSRLTQALKRLTSPISQVLGGRFHQRLAG